MPLLIFVAAGTGVCVPLPSKLTSASAVISPFRPCLSSRCLAMNYSITICFESQLKQLFPFLVVFYSTFVIMYPNEERYMPKGSVNIEKHIKTYLLNTCVFNVNPGNQGSPMFFFISNSVGWSPTGSTQRVGHQLAYCTCPGWLRWWRIWWNDDWQGKRK
jgi:hypothetical protein